MKSTRIKLLVSALVLATFVISFSYPSGSDSIVQSAHDLGHMNDGNMGGLDNFNQYNQEICVFCHTPHNARTDAGAPLWNRAVGGFSNDLSLDIASIVCGNLILKSSRNQHLACYRIYRTA